MEWPNTKGAVGQKARKTKILLSAMKVVLAGVKEKAPKKGVVILARVELCTPYARDRWGSRWSFVIAAIGSAIGLRRTRGADPPNDYLNGTLHQRIF